MQVSGVMHSHQVSRLYLKTLARSLRAETATNTHVLIEKVDGDLVPLAKATDRRPVVIRLAWPLTKQHQSVSHGQGRHSHRSTVANNPADVTLTSEALPGQSPVAHKEVSVTGGDAQLNG